MIIGLLLFILFFIIISKEHNVEKFDGLEFKYIYHAEQNQDSYSKPIKFNYPKDVYRKKYYKGQMFNTRHPGLLKHKHDYFDKKTCDKHPVLKDKARLVELPLHLTNWNHAKVPKYISHVNEIYYPDHVIGKKYDKTCKRRTFASPGRYVRHSPNKILGFNPTNLLPAQYADRSKTSIEKIIAAPHLLENRAEPVYGLLPYEL